MPGLTDEEQAERWSRLGVARVRSEALRAAAEPETRASYSYAEQLGSGFIQENLGLGVLGMLNDSSRVFADEPGFDPKPLLGGYERYLRQYPELGQARSRAELAFRKNKVDRELRHRQTLEGMGFLRALSVYLPAGLLSPENFIPIGTALRSAGLAGKAGLVAARGARPILATAGRVAAEGAITAAIAEMALQPAQALRTNEEAVLNIIGGGAFGGMLGAAGGAVGKAKRKALVQLMGHETLAGGIKSVESVVHKVLDPETPEGAAFQKDMDQFADYNSFADSPISLAYSDENPFRAHVLKALQKDDPKLAKLLALENRAGRIITGAFQFSPAMRLARSQNPASRLVGRILTGNYLTTGKPEGSGGLSAQGAIDMADVATWRLLKEQDEIFEGAKGRVGLEDTERLWELATMASRRGDKVTNRPMKVDGQNVDPFAEIRGNDEAIRVTEALAAKHRELNDIVLRTAKTLGAFTDSPTLKRKADEMLSLLEGSYVHRAMDRDYATSDGGVRLRAAIRSGLVEKSEEWLPEFREELAELQAQRAEAPDDFDQRYLDGEIADTEKAIGRLTSEDDFEDLAESIYLNYTENQPGQGVTPQSMLRGRVLHIDESYLEPFLVNDMRALQQKLFGSVIPDLVLADQMERGFGPENGLVRGIAKTLAALDARVEKAREFGLDERAADEVGVQAGDTLDDALEMDLSNQSRLLVREGDVLSLQARIASSIAARKRYRRELVHWHEKRRQGLQDTQTYSAASRELRLERRDLRDIEDADEDLFLSEEQYTAELTDVSAKVDAALTRVPPDKELVSLIEELPPDDWSAEMIGLGYRPEEIEAFRRFVDLVPLEFREGESTYQAWRRRVLGESEAPMMIGPVADRFRKVAERLDWTRTTARGARRVLLSGDVQEPNTEVLFNIYRSFFIRSNLMESPTQKHQAAVLGRADMEIAALERMKKQLDKKLEATSVRGDRPSAPTAEEMEAVRAQADVVRARIDDTQAKLEAAREEVAAANRRIRSKKGEIDVVSIDLERIRKKINDQTPGTGVAVQPFGRNLIDLAGARTPEQLQKRLDVVNRMVHARVAEARARAFRINIGHDHAQSTIRRKFRERFPNPTRKDAKGLEKELAAVRTIIDRLRHRDGTMGGPASHLGRRVRDFNYMKSMGSVLLSSLPDLALAISTAGMRNYANAIAKNLKPIFTGEYKKGTVAELAYAMERSGSLATVQKRLGVDDDYTPKSRLDKAFAKGKEAFTRATMIRRWNAHMKAIAASAIESRIVGTILKGDAASKADKQMLGYLGIDASDLPDLRKVLEATHEKDDRHFGKYFYGHTNAIRSENKALSGFTTGRLRNLRLGLETAILKGVNDTIVAPSAGTLPAFATKHELGRMLFQFRGWSFAILEKFTIPAIQRTIEGKFIGDPGPAVAAIMATTMGMAVYAMNQWLKGNDPFYEAEDEKTGERGSWQAKWIAEGLDRGGALGLLTEATSSALRVAGVDLGPTSRFASRNVMDAILGPTAGLGEDVSTLLPNLFDERYTPGDAAQVRRLIPGQNLLMLRAALDLGPNLPSLGTRDFYRDFLQAHERIGGFSPEEVNR